MTKYDKELDTSREEYEEAIKPDPEERKRRETGEKQQPEADDDQQAETP